MADLALEEVLARVQAAIPGWRGSRSGGWMVLVTPAAKASLLAQAKAHPRPPVRRPSDFDETLRAIENGWSTNGDSVWIGGVIVSDVVPDAWPLHPQLRAFYWRCVLDLRTEARAS